MSLRTQVGIVGAGPAGLMLSHLLARDGIESVVVERRSREYVTQRVRAGVLEPGTVDLLTASGLGERLRRVGLGHDGFELRFEGTSHRIDLRALTGRGITIYGQQEVVKDLIDTRQTAGGAVHFDVPDVGLAGLDSARPTIAATIAGRRTTIECDWIAGCDGFHGISREAIPSGELRGYERVYPLAWLGILVAAPPSSDELIYARHDRGFALHSMRSPEITRLYLQCRPDDSLEAWPDERIWDELDRRLELPGWQLRRGPILERGITPMRGFVAAPMRSRRLFLAGDAAHIVPPTGAKGLNLALGDVALLAEGFAAWYRSGDPAPLDRYSDRRLARVWRAQDFSYRMTTLLHRFPDRDGYDAERQLAELRYVTASRAAATTVAENYVGVAP